jgi:hypothetical protein
MIDLQVPVLTVAAKGIGGRAMQQVIPRLSNPDAPRGLRKVTETL